MQQPPDHGPATAPEPRPLSRLRQDLAQRKFNKLNRRYERAVAQFKRQQGPAYAGPFL